MAVTYRRIHYIAGSCLLLAACLIGVYNLSKHTAGNELGQRAIQLTDAAVSVTANYNLSFTYVSSGTVGSISVLFCSNGPFPDDPCVAPAGMNAGSVALASQTGVTGFTLSNSSTSNKVVLRRTAANTSPIASTYLLQGIVNPSSPGSYFARVQTFASTDASGPASDYGGIAFAINNGISVTATVPPYLIFCTAITIGNLNCTNAVGDYINFGELSPVRASSGTSEMLAATNAAGGYNISFQGTTLTSGTNEITALNGGDVSRPGTAQFGLNLQKNGTPGIGKNPIGPGVSNPVSLYNQQDRYRYVSGDTVVSSPQPDDIRQYTVSYMANIPRTQAAGIYVSTVTYICLGDF